MEEGAKMLVTKVAMEGEHLILRSRLYFMNIYRVRVSLYYEFR